MIDDKAIIKRVTSGDVLTPVGNVKIRLVVDTAPMRRALEEAKRAMAGMAIPLARPPDERNVIDQE